MQKDIEIAYHTPVRAIKSYIKFYWYISVHAGPCNLKIVSFKN